MRLKARNFFICWYFSFYEQMKHAQLRLSMIFFMTSRPDLSANCLQRYSVCNKSCQKSNEALTIKYSQTCLKWPLKKNRKNNTIQIFIGNSTYCHMLMANKVLKWKVFLSKRSNVHTHSLLSWKRFQKIKKKNLMTKGSLAKVISIAECSPWSILQYF